MLYRCTICGQVEGTVDAGTGSALPFQHKVCPEPKKSCQSCKAQILKEVKEELEHHILTSATDFTVFDSQEYEVYWKSKGVE
jgi:hypothetical protein